MTTGPDNPLGAGFFNLFTNGALRMSFEVNPAVNGTSPLGTVVEALDYAGPGSNPRQAVPEIQPCALGADARMIGVVTAGTDLKGDPGVEPGQAATVTCLGICQVLVDATVTAGQALVLSTTTAGTANSAATPTTRTLGLCLESVTVSSGTALAWAFINPGSEGGTGGGGSSFPTFTGAGSPEGVQMATAGQSYQDTSTGALYLYPDVGPGDTGWVILGGAASDINSTAGIGTVPGTPDAMAWFSLGAISIGATGQLQLVGTTILDLEVANALLALQAGSPLVVKADTSQSVDVSVDGGSMTLKVTGDGVSTTPVDSHTATTALGLPIVGTALQNTLDYDVAFTACVHVASATAGQIVMGVGPTNTPTTDPVSQPLAAAADVYVSGILPAGYHLLIDTLGTIVTSGSVETVYTPV